LKSENEILKQGLLRCNINVNDEVINKFNKYMDLLIERNKSVNLTAMTEPYEIVAELFLGSVSVLNMNIIKPGMRIIDVGTGAGFPGIPIKIVKPEIDMTLLDASRKRVIFVSEVIDKLDLKGINVVHERAEILARQDTHRENYDIVVSRAVAKLRTLCEYCIPFIKPGGLFLAYKGPGVNDEISDATNAIDLLGGEMVDVKNMDVPYSEKTHNIVIIKKTKNTPNKYPRSTGKPKKSPL